MRSLLFLSAVLVVAVVLSSCGIASSERDYPTKPIKAAGDSAITIAIKGNVVKMNVDAIRMGLPPKNYRAKLYCGKLLKGRKFQDTVSGTVVWKKQTDNATVQLDGHVKADYNFCQLYLDDAVPIPIFLDKNLEQRIGSNFQPLNSIRPNA